MISKADLKNYEFNRLEDYFNFITDSIINGQHAQAQELFNKMNRQQKAQALKYFSFVLGMCENCNGDERTRTLKFLINNEVILK